MAFTLDTGVDGLEASLNTSLRYNLGVRARKADPVLLANANTDEGDAAVRRGHLVTNRIDVLSEFDVNYNRMGGVRISAAAWNDFAYHADVRSSGVAPAVSYSTGQYSSGVERYYQRSAELLDLYAYGSVPMGSASLGLKVGRTAVLWGEALVLTQHSVSYAQAPSDIRKAISSPGVDAKETALPVGQIAAELQLRPDLLILGQYFYDWKPSRVPEAGTYFAGVDVGLAGPDRLVLAPNGLSVRSIGLEQPKTQGDWGVGLRWSPAWLEGTVGAYYREFTDRLPWAVLNPPGAANGGAGTMRFRYAEDIRLYGLSLSKAIGGVSTGFELVRRQNTPLSTGPVVAPGAQAVAASAEGARGDTLHVLGNGLLQFGPNPVWSSASLMAEIAYSRWDRVTSDPFRAFRTCEADTQPSRTGDPANGCITKDNWNMLVRFNPTWINVSPGWDLGAAAVLMYGLKGNSAVSGGGNEGGGSWALSGSATFNTLHDFTLAYNGYLGKNALAGAGPVSTAFAGPPLHDRGWVSFTYKTAF